MKSVYYSKTLKKFSDCLIKRKTVNFQIFQIINYFLFCWPIFYFFLPFLSSGVEQSHFKGNEWLSGPTLDIQEAWIGRHCNHDDTGSCCCWLDRHLDQQQIWETCIISLHLYYYSYYYFIDVPSSTKIHSSWVSKVLAFSPRPTFTPPWFLPCTLEMWSTWCLIAFAYLKFYLK